jgi:transposase
MASRSMAQPDHGVTIGIDTHGDAHVAAAFTSDLGRPLGHLTIATTPAGYRKLLEWARGLGSNPRFGVEGTGSYGAGLARFLVAAGCTVIEVNRPNRQTRYARGKSDPVDAEAAARAVLSGEATGLAKIDTDYVGMIRALRVARRSAMKMRTQTFQQMKALLVTAPAELREQLRLLSHDRLVDTAACLRPGPVTTPVAAAKLALKCLAQRHQLLTAELTILDHDLDRLVAAAAPTLCALKGVGTDVAGAVLVAAGDNPERLRSEGAFANLCGVAPLPASSGKTSGRHRLNRGGDRHANCALWRVVIVRLATHEQTRNYLARRTQEGMSKPEIIRCLKRYVAREIYRELIPRAALAAAA